MGVNNYQGRRSSRSFLNPDAPEFHPFNYFTITNNNNNNNSATNYNYYNFNYHPNHIHFPYYYSPPPPSVQLPHNLFLSPPNYQNYPYVDHQLGLNHPGPNGPNPMQPPQRQIGQLAAAPPVWAKSQDSSREGGGGARGRSRRRRGDCSNERKQGFECNNNNNNDLEKLGRSGERKREKAVIMPVKPNGRETTAMIRNIPNQYTREMLIKFLDEFCCLENQKLEPNDDRQPLAYDFLYLPIDFVRGANKGYAFVNFTNPIAVWKLHLARSNQSWFYCKSPKICRINCAAIQGKESLVEHFGKSMFVCNHEDYLPVCFSPPRDGSSASVAETTIGNRISSSFHLGH